MPDPSPPDRPFSDGPAPSGPGPPAASSPAKHANPYATPQEDARPIFWRRVPAALRRAAAAYREGTRKDGLSLLDQAGALFALMMLMLLVVLAVLLTGIFLFTAIYAG